MYGDDDTHITGQITFEQIAEAIRHKKYGRDMREAIAQGFEYFQGLWEKLDIIDSKYSEILQDYQNLDTRVGNCEKAISDLSDEVGSVKKQLSDHIDAQDKLNKNYDQRLQRLEAAIFNAEYINDTDDKPDVDHSVKVSEINDDIVPDPSTTDSSAVVIESDNDAVIPDKIN